MKITGWDINGFGMFADYRIDDLSPELTVVHGPNEAGKSTLVAFIMSVLFGFKGGNFKGPQYPPLRGGQHGGRLFLESDDGDYTVERTKKGRAPLVTRPDGTAGGANRLEELLAGADRKLFNNIFAFSLRELEEFGSLQDDAVRERIFATPTFGGGRSPSEVIKTLKDRRTRLLRPSAASTISDLMEDLKDASVVLRDAQTESKDYPRSLQELDEKSRAVEGFTEALNRANGEAARYGRLIDVWPDWSLQAASNDELGQLVVPDDATPAIADQFTHARQQIEQVQIRVNERRTELKRLMSRLGRIEVDDALPPLAKEAKSLYLGVAAYDADRKLLGEQNVQIEHERSDLSKLVADLGPGWSEDRVKEFDVSIPTAGEIGTWRDKIRTADESASDKAAQAETLAIRLAEATDEVTLIEEDSESYADMPATETIDSSDESARRLRAGTADAALMRSRLEFATQRLEDRSRHLDVDRSAVFTQLPRGVLVGALVMLVAGVAAALAFGEPIVAGILGVLVFVAAGGLLRRGASNQDDPIATAKVAVQEAQTMTDELQVEYDTLEGQLIEQAATLGFTAVPSNDDIENLLSTIASQRVARGELDVLDDRLVTSQAKQHSLERAHEKSQTDLESLNAEQDRLRTEWDTWCADKGISEELGPELALELFPAIKAARDAVNHVRTAESHRKQVMQRVSEFEEQSAAVLAIAERDSEVKGSSLAAALESLNTSITTDEKSRTDRDGIETGIEGTTRGVSEAEVELEEAKMVRDKMLKDAGALDEAAFEDVVRNINRRLELEREIKERIQRIEAAIGKGSDAEATKHELESGELSNWEQSRIEELQKAEQLKIDRDEAVREHQDKKTSTQQLAASGDVATLATEIEGYRQQLTQEISGWQTVVLASSLITATLSKFEKENQPRVVSRAGQLFEEITDGRYPELIVGDSALSVVTQNGSRVEVVDLSTGTVQQLYLCLRIALAEEFADKGTVLPLVMDDVLVNFDPQRAAQVANVLTKVSTRHQILIFTCHPETVRIIEHAAPDARIIELERFSA